MFGLTSILSPVDLEQVEEVVKSLSCSAHSNSRRKKVKYVICLDKNEQVNPGSKIWLPNVRSILKPYCEHCPEGAKVAVSAPLKFLSYCVHAQHEATPKGIKRRESSQTPAITLTL